MRVLPVVFLSLDDGGDALATATTGVGTAKACAIGPVFVNSHSGPHQKIIHLLGIHTASFEYLRQDLGQQVVGPHLAEYVSGGISGSGSRLCGPEISDNNNVSHFLLL